MKKRALGATEHAAAVYHTPRDTRNLLPRFSYLGGLTNAVSVFRMALPYHGQRTQSVVPSHHHLHIGGAT